MDRALVEQKCEKKSSLKFKGCIKLQIICFQPNNQFQTKENICSCGKYIGDKFIECLYEKGTLFNSNIIFSNWESGSDESDCESDTDIEAVWVLQSGRLSVDRLWNLMCL